VAGCRTVVDGAERRAADSVRWHIAADSPQVAMLDDWCRAVGPAVVVQSRAPTGRLSPEAAAFQFVFHQFSHSTPETSCIQIPELKPLLRFYPISCKAYLLSCSDHHKYLSPDTGILPRGTKITIK
jgi:hypothetical protein